MFSNYWKIALRNLFRHKSYTILNVAGLAIGIAACLLLFIVITYENNYESFYAKRDRTYRIVTEMKNASGIMDYNPGVPNPLVAMVKTQLPQLTVSPLMEHSGSQVTVLDNQQPNKKFIEEQLYFAEPALFTILEQHWLAGSPAALKEPNVSVLTKTIAEKYFGSWQKAMDQYIMIDNRHSMKIGGIIEDLPKNTDLPINMVSSYATLEKRADYDIDREWGSLSSDMQLMVLLPEGTSAASVNERLRQMSRNQYKNRDAKSYRIHLLQPFNTFHFDAHYGNFGTHVVNPATLYTLSFIGLLIIVMACINFVNLSTAQAVGRSREVGVRKVLGGNRVQLFWQMMGETAIIVLIAVLLALFLAKLVLPYLKNFVSIDETPPLFTSQSILFLAGAALVTTVLSGLYPSLILSGFKPALALKNKITSANIGGISIRRGLVIVQFAISQVLVIGTIVAITQMSYVKNADLGFNKEALLVLNGKSDSVMISRQQSFKRALQQLPGVQAVSWCSDVPSSHNNNSGNFSFDHKEDEPFSVYHKYGDVDYFNTFGLQLIAGRGFRKSDTTEEVVINETLAHKLGFKKPEDILGKQMRIGGEAWKPIVGVVKDFQNNTLRDVPKPTQIASRAQYYEQTAIKLHTSNLVATQKAVQDTWEKYFPEYAYDSFFVDERINNYYQQEEQLSSLYRIFAVLAILISCLGLYGLVSFMAVQKTKEVGIRKVLGASIGNIVYLFSKEFTILISIAFIIAVPVGYFLMKQWLQEFAYRIDIGIWIFLLAIIISLIIAWITVGYKALRAALANPVKSLRSE